jgi:hypothetical protein
MAKTAKLRPWTKDDVRTLKTLAGDGTKTTVIARKLKRTLGATRISKHSGLGCRWGEDGERWRERELSSQCSLMGQ